ncbi:reverse transcriptase (RNA-dependent DNA polymerase) [Algoriphagus aquaeductus]|uniref:RNA-directed DNA polymerase n=2 Tax=Algoriphagus aquaeductus TaxID=475299 RepID=A0A326RVR1_9BACT|nr:reverse transcriptase (RNA-dependent DNA polymerase) [Algoriphagus aquaeductus]
MNLLIKNIQRFISIQIEYQAGVFKVLNIFKMKIEQVHIDQIRKQFAGLQTKEDLAKLLSFADIVLYGEARKPVRLKALTYYANPALCKKRYQTFIIKKKSGADRTIHAPVKGLKSLLQSLNLVLQCIHEPHEAATGFVLEKSIVDNAKKHVGHHYVLNIDLKDFFHSFDLYRVKFGLLNEVWGIKTISKFRKENGASFQKMDELAFLMASLCTHSFEIDGELKTVLPQGSPTSPTMTNILCKKLDRRLTGLANRFGATYTRYADDITFSSPHNIYEEVENPVLNQKGAYDDFLSELKRLIKEEKLTINPKKTRLQKAGYRQEATGLIVNDKVNVRRRYVKQIRMYLNFWEKYGYEKAEQIFKRDYLHDRGNVKLLKEGKLKVNFPKMKDVLGGKLEFLKMVKGVEDNTYLSLKDRLNNLNTTIVQNPIPKSVDLNSVLEVFTRKGLMEAMELFKKCK